LPYWSRNLSPGFAAFRFAAVVHCFPLAPTGSGGIAGGRIHMRGIKMPPHADARTDVAARAAKPREKAYKRRHPCATRAEVDLSASGSAPELCDIMNAIIRRKV